MIGWLLDCEGVSGGLFIVLAVWRQEVIGRGKSRDCLKGCLTTREISVALQGETGER
jgi:hypothetical protein